MDRIYTTKYYKLNFATTETATTETATTETATLKQQQRNSNNETATSQQLKQVTSQGEVKS